MTAPRRIQENREPAAGIQPPEPTPLTPPQGKGLEAVAASPRAYVEAVAGEDLKAGQAVVLEGGQARAARPPRRFSLSAAQERLLIRAAAAYPAATRGRGRHVRTVEVLVSLGLVRGTSADFHATDAGLVEARAHGWTPAPRAAGHEVRQVVLDELPPERPPAFPADPLRERFGDRDGGL